MISQLVVPSIVGVIIGVIVAIFAVQYRDYKDRQTMKEELRKALRIEIERNEELVTANIKFCKEHKGQGDAYEGYKVVFVPLHADVWNSIINRGALHIFKEEGIIESLTESYNLIHETNGLIAALEYAVDIIYPDYSNNKESLMRGNVLDEVNQMSGELEGKLKELKKKIDNIE